MGIRVLLMEAGPMVTMDDFKTHGESARRVASRRRRGGGALHHGPGRRPAATRASSFAPNADRRAVHRRAGQPVPLVAIALHRRPHEPLLARAAAVLGLRLQEQVDARRRLRLADRLRRPRAVLRQGRAAHRRHGPPRRAAERARWHLPDARAVQAARASRLSSRARSSASRPPARARP